MAAAHTATLWESIRRLAASRQEDRLSDRELLARFCAGGDQWAFATVLHRHGALVLKVCRGLLCSSEDVEDVFQAAFLVLARKAGSLRWQDSVAGWLHQVAYRLSLRARVKARRRPLRESRVVGRPAPPDPVQEITLREALAVLHDELDRLPERLRAPLVLCYLEGLTQDQAAGQLGWSLSKFKRHLERGRALLRVRLSGRGVALSAAFLTAALASQGASAGVPEAVSGAVLLAASGRAGVVSARVLALAADAGRMVLAAKVKALALVVLAICLVAVGAGLGALRGGNPQPASEPPQKAESAAAPGKSAPAESGPPVDRFGDPLPPGAVARLGTVRLRPGGRVWRLAFSPDGKRVASWANGSGEATALSIWDTATGRELRRANLPGASLYALAWLADGRGVAVLRRALKTDFVWDFADEKAPPPFAGQSGPSLLVVKDGDEWPGSFAVSPDGKLLAAGGTGVGAARERAVHVWELATGRKVSELGPPRLLGRQIGNCTGLAFTPDGKSLLVLSQVPNAKESILGVWDVVRGGLRRQTGIAGPASASSSMAFAVAPDGHSAALGQSPDGSVRLVDVAAGGKGRVLAVMPPKSGGYPNLVGAVAFTRDGKRLLTGGSDNLLRVWDRETGKVVHALKGHHSWVEALAFSPDGKRAASGGQDGVIRIWNSGTWADGCPLDSHRYWIWSLAVDPTGRSVATLSGDGTLRVWDVATGRQRQRLNLGGQASAGAVFTPDGKLLAPGRDGRLRLRDLATGTITSPPGPLADQRCARFRLARSGKRLVTGRDDTVSIWEWPAGRLVQSFVLPDEPGKPGKTACVDADLSPDGRTLATVSERRWKSKAGAFMQDNAGYGAVDVWNVADGRRLRRLVSSIGGYHGVAFTPDGTGLMVTSTAFAPAYSNEDPAKKLAEALTLYDVDTGLPRRSFSVPGKVQGYQRREVRTIALSPDGQLLASAEREGPVLFELATGLVRRRFRGHRAGVSSLAFTPDGRRLVTGSFDDTGLVWDVSLASLARPDQAEPARLWADLASSEAEAVNRTLASLAADPAAAVALFKEYLRPAQAPGAVALDRLVADLGSERFRVREKAFAELDRLGEQAVGGLRKRLAAVRNLEVRRRIARLLEKHDPANPAPATVRRLRAVEVLEQVGTPQARALLETLGRGAPEARLTGAARAALGRLNRGRPHQ